MNAIKSARHVIKRDPTSLAAKILGSLVLALEAEREFNFASLYELNIKSFKLAVSILKEWRLDRYYAGKAKMFDIAQQARDLPDQAPGKLM